MAEHIVSLVVPLDALTGADVAVERLFLRLARHFGSGPTEPDPDTLPLLSPVVDHLQQAVKERQVWVIGPLPQAVMDRIAERIHPKVRGLSCPDGGTSVIAALAGQDFAVLSPRGLRYGAVAIEALPVLQSDRRAALQALRPHHWVKNLLVFVPLIAAHRWDELWAWDRAALAFVAFCLTSSAVYLTNDLFDIQDDRAHPDKRRRPLASGRLRPVPAMLLAAIALGIGLWLAGRVGITGILVLYAVASLVYSAKVKTIPGADILWLVGLYALRLLAGGGSTGIEVSVWLLGYGACVFGSLALAKRSAELTGARAGSLPLPQRRGYRTGQVRPMAGLGLGLAAGSLVVLVIYLQQAQAAMLYDRPKWLILAGAVVLAWLGRVWHLALRNRLQADPIVFALRDPASLAAGASVIVLLVLAAAG